MSLPFLQLIKPGIKPLLLFSIPRFCLQLFALRPQLSLLSLGFCAPKVYAEFILQEVTVWAEGFCKAESVRVGVEAGAMVARNMSRYLN